MRTIFSSLSALVFVIFSAQTLCRIKSEDQARLPFETMSALTLLFLLCIFNDPFYAIHLYDPSFITFAISEFQTSLFLAGMLVYWLRSAALVKNPKLPQNAAAILKFYHRQNGHSKSMMTFLGVIYVVLVLDFMVLYCLFFFKAQSDPTVGDFGTSDLKVNYQEDPALFYSLLVTCGILTFFYILYFIAVCNAIRVIGESDCATKVTFAISQMVHTLFLCAILMGVFSRHFMNGGLQLFFYGMCNLYIFMLAYLSWPVEIKFKEY